MKFSKQWLIENLGIELETELLIEQLTMLGLEVESVTPVAANFSGVRIGEVLEVSRVPNTDKLKYCQVQLDTSTVLGIVCGAPNARANLKVAVATVGAELPNNLTIKRAKLRGVESHGMLCSYDELGIHQQGTGIIELPAEAPIGTDLRQYLQLDDEIIEVNITPNRGDCMSILGLARELAAINAITLPDRDEPKFSLSQDIQPVAVQVQVQPLCPNYCSRVIRGVNNRLPTPFTLRTRLERSGISSVNLLVDISNYVMLLLGQPTHLFDLQKIDFPISIKLASAQERMTLLDGAEISLTPEVLVIADAKQPMALAGVMGGMSSSLSEETTEVFLESAFFNKQQVALQAQRYNLKTEASCRFERGVDYALPQQALELVTSLILQTAGGQASPASLQVSQENLPVRVRLELKKSTIEKKLGIHIEDAIVTKMLTQLGMEVQNGIERWLVLVPTFRFDLQREEDLLEEVARLYGYNNIPKSPWITSLNYHQPKNKIEEGVQRRLAYCLEDLGYCEAITYSFIEPVLHQLFTPALTPIDIKNPISSEMSVMRGSLFPGLIKALQYNLKRQQSRLKLFEAGLRFSYSSEHQLEQVPVLAGAICGTFSRGQWGQNGESLINREFSFFDLKYDVEKILGLFFKTDDLEYQKLANSPIFHPQQAAKILFKEITIGWIGQLHPELKQKLHLNTKVFLFELNLAHLTKGLGVKFKPFSKFPTIYRDLSLIVPKGFIWQKLKDKIVDISGKLLQNIEPFDVYFHSDLGSDQQSLTLRLTYQSSEGTLTDSTVDNLVTLIISKLKEDLGIELRG